MKIFPLNIYKTLVIHKSQGMTIGLDKFFEYMSLFFLPKENTLDMELVALSQAEEIEHISLWKQNMN